VRANPAKKDGNGSSYKQSGQAQQTKIPKPRTVNQVTLSLPCDSTLKDTIGGSAVMHHVTSPPLFPVAEA